MDIHQGHQVGYIMVDIFGKMWVEISGLVGHLIHLQL